MVLSGVSLGECPAWPTGGVASSATPGAISAPAPASSGISDRLACAARSLARCRPSRICPNVSGKACVDCGNLSAALRDLCRRVSRPGRRPPKPFQFRREATSHPPVRLGVEQDLHLPDVSSVLSKSPTVAGAVLRADELVRSPLGLSPVFDVQAGAVDLAPKMLTKRSGNGNSRFADRGTVAEGLELDAAPAVAIEPCRDPPVAWLLWRDAAAMQQERSRLHPKSPVGPSLA